VPAEMRDLHSVRLWRDRVHEALRARTAEVARGATRPGLPTWPWRIADQAAIGVWNRP
jgi:hypothetical protein